MTRARQHHRLGPTTALALAATLALGACTSDDPPPSQTQSPAPVAESPTPEASPTPSPSPSPSDQAAPERPAAMDRDDAEGAAAAAVYFLELYEHVFTSQDGTEFSAMSHKACKFCTSSLDRLEWLEKEGASFEGGTTTATIETTYERDPITTLYPFDVIMKQSPITITSSDGQVLDEVEASTRVVRVEVGRKDDAWVVATVANPPEDQ
jgi:hypothetical protein